MINEISEEYETRDQVRISCEVAHETRNAISACEGFIQLMLKDTTYNERYLNIVHSELKRALYILNSYSRNVQPYLPPKIKCRLNDCIREACTLLTPRCKLNSIDIKLLLKEIPEIWGDPSRIKQVLMNMIENAIKAIGKNGTVTIETMLSANSVTLSICDTGSGIDDSIKSYIFNPSFTTGSEGSGLGLCICKKIIESCGGTIALEKSVKGFTKFLIVFPAKSAP